MPIEKRILFHIDPETLQRLVNFTHALNLQRLRETWTPETLDKVLAEALAHVLSSATGEAATVSVVRWERHVTDLHGGAQ